MTGKFHRLLAALALTLVAAGAAAQSTDPAEPRTDNTPTSNGAQPSNDTSTAAPGAERPSTISTDPQQAALATGLSEADRAVAEQLRDLAAKLGSSIERKQDRAAVAAFYRDRGFAPLWIVDGAPSQRAKDAAAFLGGVEADGLDPADYPAPSFSDSSADKLARDELKLTNSVLTFARHARTGRISYSRVSAAIHYDLEFPQAADVLAHMANADNVGEALAAYNPPHAGYRALKAKLAELRSQKKNADTVNLLLANMERWRWLPRDLGKTHVMVNIPDFTLKVSNDGKTVWSTRIVVGKPGKLATPLLTETMKFITVNPTWNVPPSIIRNEYLPALQRDPNALARIGLKVAYNRDGTIRVYQPPGDRNALGRIRFNFPNRFLVYQHDTPDKHLFAHDKRAYSHGCMRVQNPERYAEVLLSISQPEDGYTAERIRRMYGGNERNINLKTPIPVHLTYQTAFVDEAGRLQTRPDLYGQDRDIIALLRNGRGIADTPVARNHKSGSRPVVARSRSRPDYYWQDRRRRAYAGRDDFFGRPFEFDGGMFYPRRPFGPPF